MALDSNLEDCRSRTREAPGPDLDSRVASRSTNTVSPPELGRCDLDSSTRAADTNIDEVDITGTSSDTHRSLKTCDELRPKPLALTVSLPAFFSVKILVS